MSKTPTRTWFGDRELLRNASMKYSRARRIIFIPLEFEAWTGEVESRTLAELELTSHRTRSSRNDVVGQDARRVRYSHVASELLHVHDVRPAIAHDRVQPV